MSTVQIDVVAWEEENVVTDRTYRVDAEHMTVIAVEPSGEESDLNAEGDPCRNRADLQGFIRELHEQGAFDASVRDLLLEQAEIRGET